MIIQRIAGALRAQDWSTITIELIVVVVGIVLGLQVDDWNEERKETAREVVYLQRLLADVDKMIAQHQEHAEEADAKLKDLAVSFQALDSCSLSPAVAERFDSVLHRHQQMPRLQVVRSAFDEMVSSGALAGLDNPEIKQKISEVYARATSSQQIIEYFSADLGRASDIIWRSVSFDLGPQEGDRFARWDDVDPRQFTQTVSYDFDRLCADAQFKNALVEVWDSTADRLTIGFGLYDEVTALGVLIRAELDQ